MKKRLAPWLLGFLLIGLFFTKYWYVAVIVIVGMIVTWFCVSAHDKKRHKIMFKGQCTDYDELEGHEFEEFIAEILEYNGYTDIEVTQSSGDKGVDIIAFKNEELYVIQCKRYSSNIGNAAVQEVYAGKDYYEADVAVVCTNTYFTKSAIQMAEKLDVLLWDRNELNELIDIALKSIK